MKFHSLLLFTSVICISAIGIATQFKTPKHFPKPTYDFTKNPLTSNKILLGRMLFYDPILSRDSSISCTSCHSSFSAFTHIDHDLSHGIGDSMGKRNSSALMNLAWQDKFMWDGAINHLDVQALAPIAHEDEMGSSIQEVVKKLNRSKQYQLLFEKAYGTSEITGEKTLKAIAQFMLTLVSANAKYDSVMLNKEAFTAQELAGYNLFKANCATCHAEPLFTTHDFANNGLPVDTTLNDFGRIKITGSTLDSLLFKIPTLRNIEYSYPYMHDGRFKNLRQVLHHYTSGIQQSATLHPALQKGIALSADEKTDLIAFLLTLSDKEFVFNPIHQFPKEEFLKGAKD